MPLQVQLKIYFSLCALKWVHVYTQCNKKKKNHLDTKVASVFSFITVQSISREMKKNPNQKLNFGWYTWSTSIFTHSQKPHSEHNFGRNPWTYPPSPQKHSVHVKKQAQWHFLLNMTSVTFGSAVHVHCTSLCCKASLDIRQTSP